MYQYRAKLVKVIDGDTVDLTVDLGFDTFRTVRVRLSGVNCPEMNTPDGQVAKLATINWFGDASHGDTWVTINTFKRKDLSDKYDDWHRYIAEVVAPDGTTLNKYLLDSGNAEVWLK